MRPVLLVVCIATLSITSIITIVMHHSLDITTPTSTLSLIVGFTIISDILGIFLVAFDACYGNTLANIGYAITQVVVIPISVYAIYYFPLYIICEVCHVFTCVFSCLLARENVLAHHQEHQSQQTY